MWFCKGEELATGAPTTWGCSVRFSGFAAVFNVVCFEVVCSTW